MTETAYDARLRLIHWASAVLFIAAMLIGLYCGLQAPGTSPRRELLDVYKSLGVTLFFLAILRILVRAATRAPPEPDSYGLMVRMAARLNHWVLYAVLLAMPISGYLFSSAGGLFAEIFLALQLAAAARGSSHGRPCGRSLARYARLSGLCRDWPAYHGDNLACRRQEGCNIVAHVACSWPIGRIGSGAGANGPRLSYCS